MNRNPAISPAMRANFRHLYADVAWFGVLSGSTLAFLNVFAARLGADGYQLGLISAGPALVNLAMSLPAGRWLQTRPLLRTTFISSLWNRAAYLLIIPLPWLFASPGEIWAMIALTALMSIPGTFLAIAFNATFADAVPQAWRGHVVGRRNALLALTILATSLLCGVLLDNITFPLNFQIVFVLGAFGAFMSSYHLGRLTPADGEMAPSQRPPQSLNDVARPGMMRFMDAIRPASGLRYLMRARKELLRLDIVRGPYRSVLVAYLFFHTAQYFCVPLFPLVWVSQLQLSDGVISLGNALFYAAMFLASLPLGRLARSAGHRRILLAGSFLYGLYPLLLGLAASESIFLVASLVGGGVWAILNGALLNHLMEKTPGNEMPAHMAIYNMVLNVGMLAGSLVGPMVLAALGLQETLFLGAAVRLTSAFLFAVLV
jgi:MFS family permease